MKILNTKNSIHDSIRLTAALSLLFLFALSPMHISADNTHNGQASNLKRFQIELYGSFATLNPSDLNLFVSYDNGIQTFFYDTYLDYLQTNNQIQSWTKNQDRERQKIKNAFPFGARLKYHLNNTFAVSLGFKSLTSRYESDIELQYTRNELSNEQYLENLVYSPYSLSAKAYMPLLGIHIMKKIMNALTLEGYLTGGPMFVECHYMSDWSYEWWIQGTNYNWLTFQSSGILEKKGSGTGIALDVGGRLAYPLFESLRIFLEGGYAYQVTKNISGDGREIKDDSSETWDGRWSIKREEIRTPWGELVLDIPTNYWPTNSDSEKLRDFELDLSGFQLRLGLSFRF
ncbi:MAG: hypothetical protein OEY18_11630 [Candidatus Aminicenantes bacterium]|nr:hypothetical protein [Candidatus Aminicenantes bacterium]